MDDIAAISGLQQASTIAQIQTTVARKILDNQQLQGQAAVKLIEAASQTADKATSGAVDALGHLDTLA